ncbi:MAG: superoxide dismutase [Propionibacteriales bacterium]|nr:superoxide dismutase [Propionibacteriales bacterium]
MKPIRTPGSRLILSAVTVVALLTLTGGAAATAAERPARAAFPETIPLPDGFQPEGITSGRGLTFYAGSLADGRIFAGDLRTGTGEVLVEGTTGERAVGMQWEARRGGRLWVAGGDNTTGVAFVSVYDARSGELLRRWEVPGTGFLNDVAVTRKAVYVTDSNVQQLVVIPLGKHGKLPPDDAALKLPLTGELVYTDGFNANGIRPLRGGKSLILVQSNKGLLFRVDPRSGDTDQVEVSGGTLASGDGLERVWRRLYVVRGNGGNDVVELKLSRKGTQASYERVLTEAALDVPSTATFAAGSLWVVNARFSTTPTPTTPYDVVRVSLR